MKFKVGSVISFLLVSSASSHPRAAEYVINEIPTFRTDGLGESVAYGINEMGVVVGAAQKDNTRWAAFRWIQGGLLSNLDPIDTVSFYAYATSINNFGQIAGTVSPIGPGFTSGFHANGSGLSQLPHLPNGTDAQALAINANGAIVGWSNQGPTCGGADCAMNPGFAVRWTGSNIQLVGNLGGYFSVASGINDSGEICGFGAITGEAAVHAFRLPAAGGAPQDIGTLGGVNSRALAINSTGQIVGWAETASEAASHGAIWAAGAAEDLGKLPNKTLNIAYAISNKGMVVGYSTGPNYADPRAVLFHHGAPPIDLNSLIDTNSGWTLQYATGVNSAGQIVAYGVRNGLRRGALLTPNLTLQLIRSSSTHGEIRWSAFFTGYQLESTTDINASNWPPLGGAPSVTETEFSVPIELTGLPTFYRLRKL